MFDFSLENESYVSPLDETDEERGIPADVVKILQRTDGELAWLARRFELPVFDDSDNFVADPMAATSADNVNDRYPE